ncbi:MAG: Crp/Fnr family transcriptional regulator [Acidiferrobacterales bacterium]
MSSSTDSIAERLAAFPMLSQIHDASWQEAVHAGRCLDIPADTVMVRKGQPCLDFLLVIDGTIRIYESAENGREILLYRLYGGEICVLTLNHLLQGVAYTAYAIAESDVSVVSIPLAHFQRALAESESFRTEVLFALSRRLSDVMQLVEQVAFHGLDLRLACLLGRRFGEGDTRCLKITHQELARELGTTREVLSRLLKSFEHRGCIRLFRGQIELVSPDALNSWMQKRPV